MADSCGSTGVLLVTYSAADDCGNITTFTARYTVTDTTAPDITCPSDLVMTCEDSLTFDDQIEAWLGMASATDNCNFDTITNDYSPDNFSDLCLNTGVQRVTFTAYDECGNTDTCSALISIIDTTRPEAMHDKPILPDCIDPADVPNFADLVENGDIWATDNCDPDPVIYLVDSTEFVLPPNHRWSIIYYLINSCHRDCISAVVRDSVGHEQRSCISTAVRQICNVVITSY